MNRKQYPYKYRFGENREVVLKRDGYKCIQCGMTRVQHYKKYGRDISVDHKDKNGRNAPKNKRNDSISNLQTLCLYCHGIKDSINNKKTKCKWGHDLTEDNIYRGSHGRIRACRICSRKSKNEWRWKQPKPS